MLLTRPNRAQAPLSGPEFVDMNSGWVADLLWGSIACLTMMSVLSLAGLFLLRQAGWWRNHTHEVIEQIDSLEQALTRSAVAEQAYRSARKPEDLVSWRIQILESKQRVESLNRLTKDNPQEQTALRNLIRSLRQPADAASAAITGGVPLAEIWPALDGMRQEEESLLRARSVRMEAVRSNALNISCGLLFCSIVLLLVFRTKWKRENIWVSAVLRRLSGAERRFNAFMDNSPLLAFIKNADSQLLYFNHAWQSFLGRPLQPASDSYFPEEIDERLKQQDRAVLSAGKPREFLEKVPAADNTTHDWLIVKFPFSTDDGTTLLGGLALDVTETRRAQEALENSEKRLQLALQSAAMQVWEYDVENDRFESFSADFELPGKTTSQLLRLDEALEGVSPQYRKRVRERLHASILNQAPYNETYQTVGGRWIVSSGQVQRERGRQSFRIVGVGQDQTERVEAEQKFAKLTKLHDSILKSTHFALISMDLNQVVTSWNPAAERLLGYTPEEVVGRATPDLWQDPVQTRLRDAEHENENRTFAQAFLHQVVKTGEQMKEWTFIRKDQSKVPVRLTVTPILDEKGLLSGFLGHVTDLSELKDAGHRVEELNQALQNTLSGWAQLNLNGCFVRVNRSFAGAAGYTADELAGLPWETTVHPDDIPVLTEAFRGIQLAARSDVRVRGLRKDGSIFYQQLFLAASNDYLGHRNGSYCFMRDHTPQVESERRLIASEKKYRQLFELNPLPCWIYNPETLQFLDVNEAAIRHYGYSRERFLSMRLSDIREAIEGERMERELNSLSSHLALTSGPWQSRLQNGSLIDVELAARDLSETARLVVVRDVTEERRAQLALRRSEHLLQEAQRIARVGSWELDTLSGTVTWGPETCHIFGFEGGPSGTSYERFLDTVHPGDRPAVISAISESIEKKQRYDLEYRLIHTDGSVRFVQGRGQYTSGSKNCLTVTVLDITEQKQVQDQLEQSLREKEVLLQEVHHRVKNNLQVISCLLNMQAGKLTDAPAVAALQESERRVMAMALIHERLYSNTRMDRINFRDYAQTLVEDLISSYSATSSQVQAVFNLQALDLSIEQAIPCGLILNELVTNVLKYAYPKDSAGELIVSLQQERGARVTLAVADRGKGLPEHFDGKKGKSLGLTIVHLLSKQLGGTLQIRSTNPGSSFSLSFPKAS